jgi:hypothetical protein
VTEVAIDMDPLGNDPRSQPLPFNGDPNPANGTLGSRQTCASRGVGETLQIDVTVRGIDPANRMTGFQFIFHYDPTKLKVTAINNLLMIAAGGSTVPLDFSDPVPDMDGTYSAAIADFGTKTEAGDGVLSRITLQSVGEGASTIFVDQVRIGDKNSAPIPTIASVLSAEECQGQPCPVVTVAPTPMPTGGREVRTSAPSGATATATATASPTMQQTATASPTATTTPAASGGGERGRAPRPTPTATATP